MVALELGKLVGVRVRVTGGVALGGIGVNVGDGVSVGVCPVGVDWVPVGVAEGVEIDVDVAVAVLVAVLVAQGAAITLITPVIAGWMLQ